MNDYWCAGKHASMHVSSCTDSQCTTGLATDAITAVSLCVRARARSVGTHHGVGNESHDGSAGEELESSGPRDLLRRHRALRLRLLLVVVIVFVHEACGGDEMLLVVKVTQERNLWDRVIRPFS